MQIPDFVIEILEKFDIYGFEAYIVGGCVRDILSGIEPKDWDITTNARPEQMLEIFPEGRYENNFGTVLIPIDYAGRRSAVEATTFRSEQGYTDRRRPDEVLFEDDLEKDLQRRDFTINAMACKIKSQSRAPGTEAKKFDYFIVDLFGGQDDMKKKIVRAVGEPSDRFKEDALRMMRAVRFSCQLDFSIEPKTERAIYKMAGALKFIANERIRDELVKILESDRAYEGVMALHRTKLLQYILPELEQGVGIGQNRHHIHTVFKHAVLSLKHCPSADWRVRLAALLHDIGKPHTKRSDGPDATFHNHEAVGAKLARRISKRLKFSNKDAEKVEILVRHHMFYYNVGEVTESSVRRLIAKVGKDNLRDLIDLRIADRLGSGVPKAKPYKLRHLEYMFERVQSDPVSVKMLAINGSDLMDNLGLHPGPQIGAILDVLLAEVIEDPAKNTKDALEQRSRELAALEIDDLRKRSKEIISDKRKSDDNLIKKSHKV